MNFLIAYAGKSGCTAEMAALLARELSNHSVTLADLCHDQPDPAAFDYVVLATSIRMNRPHKAIRQYIKAHAATIAQLPHTLCLCCAFADQFEHYIGAAYPTALVDTADELCYLGGDLSPARQKGIDKLLCKMLRNGILESEEDDAALPCLLPEHVRLLADRLRKK